jgi:AhpC/TSA family
VFAQVSPAGSWRGRWLKPRLALFGAVLSLVTAGCAPAGHAEQSASPPAQLVHASASPPAQQVQALRLASAPHAKEVEFPAVGGARTVVSFVSLRADEPTGASSRGQIAILESLRRQVKPAALQVVVIGYAGTGKQPSSSEAINAWYDWHLVGIPLLVDRHGVAARDYGVHRAPTTFLVSRTGRVLRRWDGYVAPGPLELAVTPRPR